MARQKSNFGPNLSRIVNDTPVEVLRGFLSSHKTPDHTLLQPPILRDDLTKEEDATNLSGFLNGQDKDTLAELNRICASVLEMSEGKGHSSLETVAGKRLSNTDFGTFEDQTGECHELCVSCPAHAGFRYGHALKRSSNMIAN